MKDALLIVLFTATLLTSAACSALMPTPNASAMCSYIQHSDYHRVMTAESGSFNLLWESWHADGEEMHLLFTATTIEGVVSHRMEQVVLDGVTYTRETPEGSPDDFSEWLVHDVDLNEIPVPCSGAAPTFGPGDAPTSSEGHLIGTHTAPGGTEVTNEFWFDKSTSQPTRARRSTTVQGPGGTPVPFVQEITYSRYGEQYDIVAPVGPTPTPDDRPNHATFLPAAIGPSGVEAPVGYNETYGSLSPSTFKIGEHEGIEITRIVWDNGELWIEIEPGILPDSKLPEYNYVRFIINEDVTVTRVYFDDAAEVVIGNGTNMFMWNVCRQPWIDGDDEILVRVGQAGGPGSGGTESPTPCEEVHRRTETWKALLGI